MLLLNPGFIPVDALQEEPHCAAALERLATGRRLIAFDRRGMGLSDRTNGGRPITIDDWVDDAVAVLDAVGATTLHVFANCDAALIALVLAARHAERVRSLTLVNGYARYTTAPDYPFGFDPAAFGEMRPHIQSTEPSAPVDALTLVSPSVASDPDYRAWRNAAGRRAASPQAAADLVTLMFTADLRALLPRVAAPTLLIARRGCPAYDTAHSGFSPSISPTRR